jgi:hypothetical protein
MNQLSLFDCEDGPPHSGPITSRLAAEQLENPEALRRKVFDFIASQGKLGATDEEIQIALRMSGNTQRPRRWELAKAGRIEQDAVRRKTSAGRLAQVWIASK